ncbi:3-demethoxyubiquinol 3-hydroxylase [Methylomarinovum caldicuralii]|uniref:3-demethoxyubiquinol 3-hydroxylase n=1 Tax=Methylomarinovum caldicuralii TaxID=438856 RepID=A0AAU9BQ96_9GAMM|nr:UbiH/UbiF/VisC/COQ6 family ubiquinone biosynthesis hydroxylase [Methylomarinovum caldicuralii]BCX80883.1 3-demethoxyubiquinol 3-hydroxylase [Methylomarinovum caldicuralii]
MADTYDVIIVGGGMVGATLAASLGQTPLKVALIESRRPQPFDPAQPLDLRVSAISIASRRILEGVGAWENIAAMRLCPFRRMKVWEMTDGTEFRSRDVQYPELGYIIENRLVQLGVGERLAALDNVERLCPARPRRIDYGPEGSEIELEDGRLLQGRLLVAADGARSQARQAAGIGVTAWDYEQSALVLTVETAYGQQDITWQRFTPEGPQAFLPLPGPHASLVWYQKPEEVRRLQALSDGELLDALYAAFPRELGDVVRILDRGSFPLRRQHAQRYVKPGVALIGDAAHTIHPLAGQGVNIGLLDAAALAQVVVSAHQAGRDLGALKVLQEYEAMRRRDNLTMMTTMDLFYRVFSNASLPLKLARNLGLSLAQRLYPARLAVMRYAMGLDGNLPRLARGESLTA